MSQHYFEEAAKEKDFFQACHKSEILVRTAYMKAVEGILDLGGTDGDAIQALFGINQFLSEYASLLENLTNESH